MFRIDTDTAAASPPTRPAAGTEKHFTEGDPQTATAATIVPAWWLNMIQNEIRNVLVAAGVTPDKTDDTQLADAIALLIDAAVDETPDASTTVKGKVELATNAETQAGTDAVRAVTPAGLRSATRERLTGNRSYYVATTGSDSADGLAIGTPFLTIQKAIDTIWANLDLAGYTVTINIADGTYTGATICTGRLVGGGGVILSGNAGTPANVLVNVTANNCIAVRAGAKISLQNFKLQTTTSGHCIYCQDAGSYVDYTNMNFGVAAGSGYSHMYATQAGTVKGIGNYTISGAADWHHEASFGGFIFCSSITITVSGTPAFGIAFAEASSLGMIRASGNTYSGSATGKRYNAVLNGVIDTVSGGASYFPGGTSGTTATGGQYQ